MKRIALLFAALLLLFSAPALAEAADLRDLAASLMPEYTYVNGMPGTDLRVFLMDKPDGTRVFAGCHWKGDAWECTESTPLPADAELYGEDYEIASTCIIAYFRTDLPDEPFVEQYVSWQDGAWRVTMSIANAGNIIEYADDHIESDVYDAYYGIFPHSLNVTEVDWLALPTDFVEAIGMLDTTGYEAANTGWEAPVYVHMPEAEAVAFGVSYLPEYTVWDGRVFSDTAMLLVDDASGERRFIGGQLVNGVWQLTISTPLPAGTVCDTFHAYDGHLRIILPLPRDKQNVRRGADDLYAYVNLQEDGTWQVTGVNNGWEVIALRDNEAYRDVGPTATGILPLIRDVTVIDWAALPVTFQEVLDLMEQAGPVIISDPGWEMEE